MEISFSVCQLPILDQLKSYAVRISHGIKPATAATGVNLLLQIVNSFDSFLGAGVYDLNGSCLRKLTPLSVVYNGRLMDEMRYLFLGIVLVP